MLLTLVTINDLWVRLLTFTGMTMAFCIVPVARGVWARAGVSAVVVEDELLTALLRNELARAERQGRRPWWEGHSETVSLPGFFAYWVKKPGRQAAEVTLATVAPLISTESLNLDDVNVRQPARKKGCLGRVDGLLSGQPMVAEFAPIDWETVLAVEARDDSPPAWSLFGIEHWQPWPSLSAAHCIIQTADHYLIMTLRNGPASGSGFYFPSRWSVSFEEQIELGARPDGTIADTALRGLKDEFGIDAQCVADVRCLAVGREVADMGPRRIRNSGFVVTLKLNISVSEVWQIMDGYSRIVDHSEGKAWYGCRFPTGRDAQQFLAEYPVSRAPSGAREIRDNGLLRCAVTEYPGSDLSTTSSVWHPTSHARLRLWAD